MNNETLQNILDIIRVNSFALVVIQTEEKPIWSYTVGLFSKPGMGCELVFTEKHDLNKCVEVIDRVLDIAAVGEILFNVVFDVSGYVFTLVEYHPQEYADYPLTAANEYFGVDVPAIKVVILAAPK